MSSTTFNTTRAGELQDSQLSDFQDAAPPAGAERSIGQIIKEANNLSPDQIEQILAHQRDNGVRFGEAAVALGMASSDDVLWALAQQFHYPSASGGRVSLNPELVVGAKPFSKQAEAFRSIRSHIIMKVYSDEGPRPALSILSPDSGDGKTYFAANLAVAFSQLSGRTLLIDADMRTPRLHEVFNGINRQTGLSSILSGRAASKVIQSVKELPSLFLLPAGPIPPNPLELLERQSLGLLLRELKTKFDHIIVDTPAGTLGSDGPVIAAKCGAALILGRQDRTQAWALQELVKTVQLGPAKLVGAILNEY